MRQPHLVSRMQGFGTTIFDTMTELARGYRAVNLGQGFPDDAPPAEVANAAMGAIQVGHNQYAPGAGIAELREAIARHQLRFHSLRYDPDTEVTVTAGATEAIAASVLALCEMGDEVIVLEPFYDSYPAAVALAGATHRSVPLQSPDFRLDLAALQAAVGPRTRAIIVNSPHNPTGRVFDDMELASIARLCNEHDLVAISDEVYEHLVHVGAHRPLASFPGMRDRTITISSAAKTFAVTGWKIGWICAPPTLTSAVRTVKQFLTYSNGTPFQHAVAVGLDLPDEFYTDLTARYRGRRDRLCEGLEKAGFVVREPAATYFVTVDVRDIGFDDGLSFCMNLPERVGVVAIPVVAFHDDVEAGRPFVRFAYCRSEATLDEGIRRLANLRA